MSRKRTASSDNLTGGTRDVNPQFYVIRLSQSAADTATDASFPLPVPKYPGSANRAIVFELMKVRFLIDDMVNVASTQALSAMISSRAVSLSSSLDARADPGTLASFSKDFLYATAVGFQYTDRDIDVDLTDKAGHGILVATDNIYLTVYSQLTGRVNTIVARLTYRLKEVGLAEYVGIVQSQQ